MRGGRGQSTLQVLPLDFETMASVCVAIAVGMTRRRGNAIVLPVGRKQGREAVPLICVCRRPRSGPQTPLISPSSWSLEPVVTSDLCEPNEHSGGSLQKRGWGCGGVGGAPGALCKPKRM